jgi:hypothetical protein
VIISVVLWPIPALYDRCHFESGTVVWERRDVKKLGTLAYDAFEGALYCLCEKRSVVLTASSGKERAYYRSLNDVFVSKDSTLAVFDAAEVKLQNRATNAAHVLPRATGNSCIWLGWHYGLRRNHVPGSQPGKRTD